MAVQHSSSLSCRGLVKSFSGVTVLKAVDFDITRGAIVGLVGENGAGKSTLSNIIAGILQPDAGSMTLDGEPYRPKSPGEALDAGVVMFHQEIRMVPQLSVAENIYIGRLPLQGGRVNRQKLNRDATEILGLLGVDLDPDLPVGGLPMAAQQEIEIAKAITRDPPYVIFDEPTASLGGEETERVLERIKVLRERDTGVVYISHRLEEVREIADQVVCLRDGERVASWDDADVSHDEVMSAMVGREFVYEHHEPPPPQQSLALEVRHLGRDGVFKDINFDLAEGEILGFAGLVGAGRTEVVRVIAGADPADHGEILMDGQPLTLKGVRSAVDAGIHMVPEDRKGQGLNLKRTAGENITLPWERQLTKAGCITPGVVREVSAEQWEALDIRGPVDLPVISMSGGNQQKVLLGKWLVEKPRVMILDEPTRGVDVGAKMAMYEIIRQLAAEGVALIVVSSELEEVLGLSHRILVMAEGEQRGMLTREDATPENVMALAVPPTASGSGHTQAESAA